MVGSYSLNDGSKGKNLDIGYPLTVHLTYKKEAEFLGISNP